MKFRTSSAVRLAAVVLSVLGVTLAPAQESADGFTPIPAAEPAALGGFGNSPGPAAAEAASASTAGLSSAPYSEYRLAPHDVVQLWVYQANEFNIPARVSPSGSIRLPLCREPIAVANLTPGEAERAIAQALVDEGLLVDPTVMLEVKEYHARPVLVSGAVRNPTIFQAVGPTTLLEAMSRAGGLAEHAGSEILIQRRAQPGFAGESLTISAEDFRDGLNGVQMLPIHGGESIRVPPAPTAFVVGAGGRAGPIALSDPDGMEFFEFMARAGVQPSSKHRKAIIFRPRAGGNGLEKDQIEVDLKKVITFEVSSLTVLPEDVVYFVESDGRAAGLLGRVFEAGVMQAVWRGTWLLWR